MIRSQRHAAILAAIIVAAIAFARPAVAADKAPPSHGEIQGTLKAPVADGAKLALRFAKPLNDRMLDLADAKAKEKLNSAEIDDLIKVDVDDPADPKTVLEVKTVSRPVSVLARVLALGAALAILLLIAAALTGWKPQRFIIGVDERYSNSQTQLVFWFGAVASVYAAAVALRIVILGWDYIGGVGIGENLMLLTGLSAFSFGGAKVIAASKAAADPNATQRSNTNSPNALKDLVQNDDGRADIGDLQMILVTLAAVAIFGLSAFKSLGALAMDAQVTLPDVDSTLLAGFGLGQGAYLVKKAALPLGTG